MAVPGRLTSVDFEVFGKVQGNKSILSIIFKETIKKTPIFITVFKLALNI